MMNQNTGNTPQWSLFEQSFRSSTSSQNPASQTQLSVTFHAPSGKRITHPGFWDGGTTWRVRFAPDEVGTWTYTTTCADITNAGLHDQGGSFLCTDPTDDTVFTRHGPIRMAANRRHLAHTDGTPFFWLADTAWNGPLRATDEEWRHYIQTRVRQGFSAVQWVATDWRSAPDGDIEGNLSFTGPDPVNGQIAINPLFFQRMDRYIAAMVGAGLLCAPVMLWANKGGQHPERNPGVGLSEENAVTLARYMVARWSAYPVLWILPGDGKYEGEEAARWRRIGAAVFGGTAHAPVALHLCGQHYPIDEFRDEEWLDILGYQSGHGDSDATVAWITSGPPATAWRTEERLLSINFEPAYENHVAYHSKEPHSAHSVRKAIYWSLLNAPTAGSSYGGHGVWGWDDGSGPPVDHAYTGTPLPWQLALVMDGAEQMAHLSALFTSIAWWTLRPAPEMLADQPGNHDPQRHILCARTPDDTVVLSYTPEGDDVLLVRERIPASLTAYWFDPRTRVYTLATGAEDGSAVRYRAPGSDDWMLVLAQHLP